MKKSLLLDQSKCIGCRACQVACKQWNQLPAETTVFSGSYENPPAMSANTWSRITFQEVEQDGEIKWFFGNHRCMHCSDAACVTVCPSGAIQHTEYGTVRIDQDRCIGCNYCVANCPFQVVSFNRQTNKATKCDFCYDRLSSGLMPACATACPTGAITYGDRSDMIGLAHQRASQLQSAGKPNAGVYGLAELGTGMLAVLEDDPEYYQLPAEPQVPLSARLWGILFRPLRVVMVIVLAFGFWANKSSSQEAQQGKDEKKKL